MVPGQYPDEERRCFAYAVAGQAIHIDPLTARRRLDHYLGRPLNDVLAQARSPDEAARFQADEDLLAAARLAFEKPWDEATGAGATEDEMRAAVGGLSDFLYGRGTTGVTPPPSSQPSGPFEPFPDDTPPTSAYSST